MFNKVFNGLRKLRKKFIIMSLMFLSIFTLLLILHEIDIIQLTFTNIIANVLGIGVCLMILIDNLLQKF